MDNSKLEYESLKEEIIELMKENKRLENEKTKISQALKYQYEHLQDYSIPGDEVEEQKRIIKEKGIENQGKIRRIELQIKKNDEKINKFMKRYKDLKELTERLCPNKKNVRENGNFGRD